MRLAAMLSVPSVFVLALAPSLAAQQEAKPTPAEPPATAVVMLSHADASDVANALGSVGYQVSIRAVDNNRLVIRGLEKDVQELELKVIPSVDVPRTHGQEAAAVEYIRLGHQTPPNLYQMLETVAPQDRATTYAFDQAKRTLVMRGDLARIAEVKRLVAAVDRPAEPLTVQFFFIRGQIDGAKGENNLPGGLEPVAKALMANGFTKISLLAPIVVSTRDGESFEASAQIATGTAHERRLHVRSANLAVDTEAARLNVQARVESPEGLVFGMETAVTAKLGGYTLLAAAPGSTEDGDAIAVALRVTRSVE